MRRSFLMKTFYSIDANTKTHFCSCGKSELLWRYLFGEFYWNQTCRRKLKGPYAAKQYMKPFSKIKIKVQNRKLLFFFSFLFCLFVLNKWCCMLQIFPVAGGSNWSWTQTSVYISRYNLHFVCSQFPQLLLPSCYNYINLSMLFEFF